MTDFRNYDTEVTERFLRYVKIWTTSDREQAGFQVPTTGRQWDLIRLLESELKEIGVTDVFLDEKGFLIGRIPASPGYEEVPCIGFMAHVDTSDDVTGENVKPILHKNYDGKDISITEDLILSPELEPELLRYIGETVITTDGSTLLGADDKAGVAEIMTAASALVKNRDLQHGPVELIFTPDEETGTGMDSFPLDQIRSKYCFTMDGGTEGEIESECYYASSADIHFFGNVVHPGYGRGRLVNAAAMAACFGGMIPRSESPEATDGRYGNYWIHSLSGKMESASVSIMIRDFSAQELERRKAALRAFALATEAAFPGGKADITFCDQYKNMREAIDQHPVVMQNLRKAVEGTGIEPVERVIRGGTDGSRLTAMGIPTPNVFAGGHNFHSRKEWVAVPALSRSVAVIINLLDLFSQ